MRFLIDASLSSLTARSLAAAGHDAVHVRDLGLVQAEDIDILIRAQSEGRVVITADTDFGTLLATRSFRDPSVILFRVQESRPSELVLKLLRCLPSIESLLPEGVVVVIDDYSIRIRQLPIAGKSG